MRKDAILSEVFFARIKAVEALMRMGKSNPPTAGDLRDLAAELDSLSLRYGHASTASAYAALADLLRIVSTLVEWRAAVLDALPDADRFVRSAKERYLLWLKEYGDKESAKGIVSASRKVEDLISLDDVESLCRSIASTPLAIGVFAEDRTYIPRADTEAETKQRPTELSVAFLKFQIDAKPAGDLHHLTPNEVHDLEIEVRVSRWPDVGKQLKLSAVTIEPSSSYDFPEFTFDRPAGQAPYILVDRGRALLKVAQGLQARPFEFKYAAEFLPSGVEQPVAVVGHRTLLIEGLDLNANPVTGYRAVDRKIVEIRNALRRQGQLPNADLSDSLKILTVLSNVAGRAVQDAEFTGVWTEAQFQDYVRKELRRRPEIGAELDEHAHASGGVTDLSYHGIPIELKSQSKQVLKLEDCQQFVEQTASYAVAKGKRVGILCVLDCSPKTSAPQPAEAGIDVFHKATKACSVAILVVLVQGNLAKPSSLS